MPGELRNAVYTYALTFHDPLIIADSRLFRRADDANDNLIELQGYGQSPFFLRGSLYSPNAASY